jgi:uncharacterized membrane protein YuzA (DUF378 family)
MRLLNPIALLLVIVGALNWGLVGLFEFDLVAEITGDTFGEYLALTVLPGMFRQSTDRPRREHIAQA